MIDPTTFEAGTLYEHGPSGTVWKLSTAYEATFTASQVYPVPNRTTVTHFPWHEGVLFREPPKRLLKAMDAAWGFSTPTT